MFRRAFIGASGAALVALAVALPASAGAAATTGGLPAAHVTVATNQSDNWSGYSEPLAVADPYESISATWVVPTATQHTSGQAESSATWVGIGGGCITSDCLVGDETLVQAGTEQDVAANGTTSYSAWWEIVPVPSVTFSSVTVNPGDTVSVSLTQTAPEVWDISFQDLTDGSSGTATQTIPYPSDYSTAEFIEETPLSVGTSGTGLTDLPTLGTVGFTNAEVNGTGAGLTPADEMQLTDSDGNVIATPSAPNSAGTAFNDCTWATSCTAP